ncbi:MAG: hypothetical protein ACM3ZE_15410 [Myxococcales bacterium]
MLDRERKRSDRVVVPQHGPGAEHRAVDPSDDAEDRGSVRSDRTTIVPKPLDELDGDVTVQRSPLTSGELGAFELDEPDVDDPDLDDPDLEHPDLAHLDGHSAGQPEDPDLDDPELKTRVRNDPDLDITREIDARELAAQAFAEAQDENYSGGSRELQDPDSDEPTLIGYQGRSAAGTAAPRPFKTLDSSLPIGVNRPRPEQTPVAAPPASMQPPPASILPPPASTIRGPSSGQAVPTTSSSLRPQSVQPPPASTIRPPPIQVGAAPGSLRPPPLVAPPASSSSMRPPSTTSHPPPLHAPVTRHDSQISQTAHLEADGDRPEKWYLRVQLNTECVADLWVRDLTPHNVLVWSEDMQTWVPLLTVRKLREAIRDAHDTKTRDEVRDSSFVFLSNTQTSPSVPPPPRVPASMTAAAAPRPSSRWALPKPRTISNVPPPLLTASTPILASGNQTLMLPQPRPSTPPSTVTVPPAFRAQEITEVISDVEVIPDIPRPARVPSLESVQPMARFAAVPARASSTRPPPPPSSPLRRAGLYAALPLMHVERVVWLVAGVAVASAVALLVRGGEPSAKEANAITGESAKSHAAVGAPTDPAKQAAAKTVSTPSNKEDVHRLEDLPVVGKTDGAAAPQAPDSNAGRVAVRSGRKGAVQPANVHLASSPTLTPASGQDRGGSFDTAAARRILTSSAARASRCASEGSASGSVVVTFAPSGFVQSATMAGLKGQGTNVGCVLRAFQEARVAPFSGSSVTVRKGFQIP